MTTTNDTTSKKMTDAEIEHQASINYDALNGLHERLAQVSAMLTITYGNDGFQEWGGDTQDNYLWACSTMIEQAKEMASRIDLKTER
jgi:hypothetical protein